MSENKPKDGHQLDHLYKHLFEEKWFELEDLKPSESINAAPHLSEPSEDQFRRASLLRELGALNYRKSIQQNHASITTCYQLASDLDRYEAAVVHRSADDQSSNMYLNDCLAMLKIAEPTYSLRDWRTAVGKQKPTIARLVDEEYENLPCRGAHLECRAEELQPDQLRRMLDGDDRAGQGRAGVGDRSDTVLVRTSPADNCTPEDDQITNSAATQIGRTPRERPGTSKWQHYCVPDKDEPFGDTQCPPTSSQSWPRQSQQSSRSTPPDYGKRSRPDNSSSQPTMSEAEDEALNDFRTASEVLLAQQHRPGRASTAANGAAVASGSSSTSASVRPCKRLGLQRKPPPKPSTPPQPPPPSTTGSNCNSQEPCEDERLRHIDPLMVERIRSEIMDTSGASAVVEWADIAGLQFAKQTIIEAVVYPMLRPDLFSGLRRPPRGILLFGPPGTGKTLIGKCIAAHSKATFFSISASSLTSKWIGEGEKMVRALFAVAAVHSPAVIFIDEIDSMLTQRSDSEHESSRRLKTEFLVQLDGVASCEAERILVVGATNRPQELDEAARRRLVKRLYIPLPDCGARVEILRNLLRQTRHSLTDAQIAAVAEQTDGYSGADMRCLCQEAAMFPLRTLRGSQLEQIELAAIPALRFEDFEVACGRVRPSVSPADLEQYVQWDRQYGSGGFGK